MRDERTPQETNQAAAGLLSKEYDFVKKLQLVVELLAGYLSLPAEVVLHRGFGQRYLTVVSAVAVVFCLLLGSAIVDGDFVRLPPIDAAPVVLFVIWFLCSITRIFCLIFVCLSVRHLLEIWRTIQSGVHVHTRYSGAPLPMWARIFKSAHERLDPAVFEFRIKRFAEPALVFFAGLATMPLSLPFGTVMAFCGGGLFTKANLEYWRLRNRILDIMDGITEGQFLQAIVKPGAKKQAPTRGFAMPVTTAVTPVLKVALAGPTLQDAIHGLSAELRAIMTPAAIENGKHHAPTPSNGKGRIAIRCPGCERDGKLPPEAAGQKITCPCGTSFVAPLRERRTE